MCLKMPENKPPRGGDRGHKLGTLSTTAESRRWASVVHATVPAALECLKQRVMDSDRTPIKGRAVPTHWHSAQRCQLLSGGTGVASFEMTQQSLLLSQESLGPWPSALSTELRRGINHLVAEWAETAASCYCSVTGSIFPCSQQVLF